MEHSEKVADIHTKSHTKNLVTTERTIHLPEQKETFHMISLLRKETCFAHISTQNSRLSKKGINEDRQFDHNSENCRLVRRRHTSQL